jgi:hypothetical protein
MRKALLLVLLAAALLRVPVEAKKPQAQPQPKVVTLGFLYSVPAVTYLGADIVRFGLLETNALRTALETSGMSASQYPISRVYNGSVTLGFPVPGPGEPCDIGALTLKAALDPKAQAIMKQHAIASVTFVWECRDTLGSTGISLVVPNSTNTFRINGLVGIVGLVASQEYDVGKRALVALPGELPAPFYGHEFGHTFGARHPLQQRGGQPTGPTEFPNANGLYREQGPGLDPLTCLMGTGRAMRLPFFSNPLLGPDMGSVRENVVGTLKQNWPSFADAPKVRLTYLYGKRLSQEELEDLVNPRDWLLDADPSLAPRERPTVREFLSH